MFSKIMTCLGLLLCVATFAWAGEVKLEWDYVNAGQKGFNIYYGPLSQLTITGPKTPNSNDPLPYAQKLKITDPAVRSATLTLPPGVYFFRSTAFGDTSESLFSNEAGASINFDAPNKLRVTIIVVGP